MSATQTSQHSEGTHPDDSPGNEQTRRDALGLWAGILTGPILWFTHQQLCFTLVPWACDHGGVFWLHAATLLCLAGTIIVGLAAFNFWRREDAPSIETERKAESIESEQAAGFHRTAGELRVRFMAVLGVFSSLFFALMIIAQGIPNFILDPCQR